MLYLSDCPVCGGDCDSVPSQARVPIGIAGIDEPEDHYVEGVTYVTQERVFEDGRLAYGYDCPIPWSEAIRLGLVGGLDEPSLEERPEEVPVVNRESQDGATLNRRRRSSIRSNGLRVSE